MASQAHKQQIIENIKEVTNILVTVSADPSVDELSAALGLTIFLNNLGKQATAVFSGSAPPAIGFLEPDKTFESTTNSLRDFIISFNKEKAHHLRYKVIEDMVKIFVTPYRTALSEADLEFSQGDYNVELVVALNVQNSDQLDAALAAHGQILHDATVATVTAGSVTSSLGSIRWHDDQASSVSEMMTELINGLKTAQTTLNEQIATALLTGIVAATERFSNDLTSSRAMTTAAELMAVGANQHLIATKLKEGEQLALAAQTSAHDADAPEEEDTEPTSGKKAKKKQPKDGDGALLIDHERRGDVDEVARQIRAEAQEAAAQTAHEQLNKLNQPAAGPSLPPLDSLTPPKKPSIGGTLNATAEQAAEDKERELAGPQNKTILNHGTYIGSSQPSFGDSPLNAAMGDSDEPPHVDPIADLGNTSTSIHEPQTGSSEQAPQDDLEPAERQTLSALAEDTDAASHERKAALEAVDAALATAPPAPDLTKAPTLADIESEINGRGLPPLPDFADLPPLPPLPIGPVDDEQPAPPTDKPPEPPAAASFNPSQFHIPEQK